MSIQKVTTSSYWKIWPAKNWSEFQIAMSPNLYNFCVFRMNCCLHDLYLWILGKPKKLLVSEDFSSRNLC